MFLLRNPLRSLVLPLLTRPQKPINRTMSDLKFTQAPHKLLLIPGPIEFDDDVLYANTHPGISHVSPEFIPSFGNCIRMLREVLFTQTGQPFLIAGSGTLGWDCVAANLVEQGEGALVLNSGYFGDSFADCLETYGAKVDQIKAPIGEAVKLSQVEDALQAKKYKIVTVTHVDTSTGVLSDAKNIASLIRKISPETLVILDAVCSVASEEIRFDDWDLDVVLSATQKGLGTPPGLSVLVASQRALKVLAARKSPVPAYYASWRRWLPIMQAYERGQGAYFATPPVNLIYALEASLKQITRSEPSLEERFRLHRETSKRVKDTITALGMKQVPVDVNCAANGMTAVYYPEGVRASDLLSRLEEQDVLIAGGLHKEIKDQYFRIGHMGVSAVDGQRSDIQRLISALQAAILEIKDKQP